MSNTLILVLASIIILILLLPLLFYFRRRVELRLEKDVLFLDYPFSTRKIDLENELQSWHVQNAHYIRWGIFSTVTLKLNDSKRIAVSSLFNQENYDLIFRHLKSRFPDKRSPTQTF